MKKLIITESQYTALTKFIVETKFNEFIKNTVKKGDTIRIHWRNNVSNFIVVDSFNGQIQMDNIDKGSTNINYRYFMTQTSLNGHELTVKRVHKINEKDKLSNPSTWGEVPVNDIKDIEVIRNGEVIDTVDDLSGLETQTDEVKDKMSDILTYIVQNTEESDIMALNTNSNFGDVNLLCVNSENGNFTYELDDLNKLLQKWDSFTLIINTGDDESDTSLLELNPDTINTTDGGKTFNLKFTIRTGQNKQDLWIKNITDLKINNSDNSEENTEDSEENTDDEVSDEDVYNDEGSIMDRAEKYIEIISNDPLMRKAFFKEPSIWDSLVAAAKGKNPRGVGVIPSRKLIGTYKTNQIKNKIGPSAQGFRPGKATTFKFIDKTVIMNPTGQLKDKLTLPLTSTYRGVVQRYRLNDNDLVISSSQPRFKITIKDEIEGRPNSFNVVVIKEVRSNRGIETYEQNARVRFANSKGTGYYNPEPTKEPNTK